MKITVKDCLSLDIFKDAIVAAGKRNLDNIVKSVSVLDADSVKTALNREGVRDRVLFTSFTYRKEDVELKSSVLKALAGKGVAAVFVFHTDVITNELYGQSIKNAEAMGMPLVFLPNGSNAQYAQAIEQIMNKLLVGDNIKNNLINNTIYHILDFEKHSNFESALREAAINNDFQVVLISKDFNPILVVETRHKATISDAIRLIKQKGSIDEIVGNSSSEIEGVAAYWKMIDVQGKRYFLLIVDNEDAYASVDMMKLAEIIELAAGMWRYTPVSDKKTEFVKALVRGNKSLAYTIRDEINMQGNQLVSAFYIKGISANKVAQILDDFEKRCKCEVMSISDGDETHGVVRQTSDDVDGLNIIDSKNDCIKLYEGLKEISKSVRIFHVTGGNGVEGLADAFRLISETWAFVGSVFPFKRLFSKYELALVSNCIMIQVQGGHIKKNYTSLLDVFEREIGANKAKQLQDTLETFVLDAGMKIGKTSEIIGIHNNTVQYRLKRINEILNTEITGNRVIPGLTIALAIRRLERVIE